MSALTSRARGASRRLGNLRRAHGGRSLSVHAIAKTAAAALIGLLLITALTGWVSRTLNGRAVRALETRAAPAELDAINLRDVYQQVHIAQVAFQYTGAPRFSAAEAAGFRQATRLTARLSTLFSDDPPAAKALATTQAAAGRWRALAFRADAARAGRPLTPRRIADAVDAGTRAYSTTARHVRTVLDRIAEMARSQLSTVTSRQTTSNFIAWSALAAAVLVAVGAVPILRRKVTRPLQNLLQQVRAVSIGDVERPIKVSGAPTELAEIAAASEQMRTNLLRGARELGAAQRRVAVHEERNRFAGDLHDHAVQEVFALSLTLSAASARHPELAGLFEPLIEQTDRIIRQFRAIIFDVNEPVTGGALSAQLRTVTASSARALGFSPTLALDAATVDSDVTPQVAANLVAVLRESLSNVARHAHATHVDVDITTDDEAVQLRVRDNGAGLPSVPTLVGQGLENLRDRARRLGGTAQILTAPGSGTTVIWRVRMRGLGGDAPAPVGAAPDPTRGRGQ